MNLSRDAKKALLALLLSLLSLALFIYNAYGQEPTPEDATVATLGTPAWDNCVLDATLNGGDPAGHYTASAGKAICFVVINAPSFFMLFYDNGDVLDSYHVTGVHTGVVRWWRSCDPDHALYGCPTIKNVYIYTRPDQHYLHFFPLLLRESRSVEKSWAYP